jgi:hypothetical protein
MLKGFLNRILFRASPASGGAIALPADPITGFVDPGAPYFDNEPVARWPEEGAALKAVPPAALLATQKALVQRIRSSSPLLPADFDTLVMPALERYVRWVHLLPASEQHHHFGAGGLLCHGLEVAMHAARIADGKQVGIDLDPSERAVYMPRWKTAAMFGGLLHDIGKPLVDCGARSASGGERWPASEGPLYDWLLKTGTTDYRIYWRPGSRHERHKAVGTSVVREILGPELLKWFSREPTQQVVDLMMTSIATGRSASNLMSQVISDADSMSVEADLKRLAERTRATGQGGSRSAAALVMAEIRRNVESGKIGINTPGKPLWWTTEGCFATTPAIFDVVIPLLAKKQVQGMPTNRMELIELLEESGFTVPAVDEASPDTNRSSTWQLKVALTHKGEVTAEPTLTVLRFSDPGLIFGDLPLPTKLEATATPPFMTAEAKAKVASEVTIVDDGAPAAATATAAADDKEPQAAAPAAVGPAPDGGDPPTPTDPESAVAGQGGGDEVHIESRRNRGDLANKASTEVRREREKFAAEHRASFAELLGKIEAAGLEGSSLVALFERLASRRLVWGADAFEVPEGLAVRWPEGFANTGLPPSELIAGLSEKRWLCIEVGGSRKVTERDFPNGDRSKCIILTGLVARAWAAMRTEHPEVLEGKKVDLGLDERVQPIADAPPGRGTSGDRAPRDPGHGRGRPSQPQGSGRQQRPDRYPVSPEAATQPPPRGSQPRPGKPRPPAVGAAPVAPRKGQARDDAAQAPDAPAPTAQKQSAREFELAHPFFALPEQPEVTLEGLTLHALDEDKVVYITALAWVQIQCASIATGVDLSQVDTSWIQTRLARLCNREKLTHAAAFEAIRRAKNPLMVAKPKAARDFMAAETLTLCKDYTAPRFATLMVEAYAKEQAAKRAKGKEERAA